MRYQLIANSEPKGGTTWTIYDREALCAVREFFSGRGETYMQAKCYQTRLHNSASQLESAERAWARKGGE